MKLIALLSDLKEMGIRLWLEGDQLKYQSAEGMFSRELKEQVRVRKDEIIQWLREQQPVAHLSIPTIARTEAGSPLSYTQQRLWFLNQYEGHSKSYHCPAVIPLPDDVDAAALEAAINTLCFRHESLRTRFVMGSNGPVQHILPCLKTELPVHDFSCSSHAIDLEVQGLVDKCISERFDLENGPLFRVALLCMPNKQHYLLLCMHHIITDGWSMGIFQRELIECYENALRGENFRLEELPVQYADYASWQREQVEQYIIPQQWPYWEKILSDAPRVVEVPTDFTRPAIKSNQGAIYRKTLGGSLGHRIIQTAESEGVTVFMFALAAFNILISRYTRQDDIVLGTPVANRVRSDLNGIIGFFVNTIVLRSQPLAELPFSTYLQQVRKSCLDALDHQELPFEVLVDKLGGSRDLSRSPLFQIMFAFQNTSNSEQLVMDSLSLPFNADTKSSKFDLNVSLTETSRGFEIECEYATDLYCEETVAQLFDSYECLLFGVCDRPAGIIGSYELVPLTQKQAILSAGLGRQLSYDRVPTITELFKAQVAATPEATALCFSGESLSYQDLAERVDNAATRLASLSAKGSVVALMMDRSIELVVSILATLQAGAAYLPLDTELPRQRLDFILAEANPAAVLIQQDFRSRFSQTKLPIICVDAKTDELGDVEPGFGDFSGRGCLSQSPVVGDISSESAAYIIYTSGSTGMPKGVINSHRGLFNRLEWMQENHPITRGDCVLQKTNYAFDVSVWEFVWPLTRGATLVLAKPDGHKDPAYLAQVIREMNVTVVHFVPSMFQLFLGEKSVAQLHSLRAVFCSGEALPCDLVSQFNGLGLQSKLYNLYGPTEAAIDVTCWDCSQPSYKPQTIPIGYPITNCNIYILDSNLGMVPKGVPGEIVIGGMGLAHGYLNRPELTAQSFVADLYSGVPNSRMYRTGDLGRFLPDGSIEYLGRIDFQVKIRGQRIEIGEIEYQLLQLPGVEQAVVVVAQSAAGESHLVSYYRGNIATKELTAALSECLPEYMVPKHFVKLDDFPLNRSGKLDRKALVSRGLPKVHRPVFDDVGPLSEVERRIQQIWQSVLVLEHVGAEQNFFELGGSSLLMVQVHRELNVRFGLDISLVKLFSHPTIRGLAQYIVGEEKSPAKVDGIAKMKTGNQRMVQLRQKRKRAAQTAE